MHKADLGVDTPVSPVSAPIRFSTGCNTFDNTPEQIEVEDFKEFAAYMDTNRGKKKGENYVCAPLQRGPHNDSDKYSEEAHYRLSCYAQPCRFLSMDIDHMAGPQVQEQVLAYIKFYRSYAYETASSTSASPRMRILFDLNREVDRSERKAFGIVVQANIEAVVEAEFGDGAIQFDPSVYRPEQPNYCPIVGAKTWRFLDCPPLCVDDFRPHAIGWETYAGTHASRDVRPSFGVLGPIPRHLLRLRGNAPKENPFAAALYVLKTPNLLAQLKSALAVIPSDDRDTWIAVGHSLKTLDGDGEDVGRELWLSWSAKSPKFDLEDAERVWNSLHPNSTSHEKVFTEAEKHGWDYQVDHRCDGPSYEQGSQAPLDEPSSAINSRDAGQGGLNAVCYDGDLLQDVVAIPRRDWKIPKLLLGRYISLVVGPGGVSKSMLQLIAAVSVATGRDLLGFGRVQQCKALVINNEDDEDELRRRLAAVVICFEIDPAELTDRLFTVSGYENTVRFAVQAERGVSSGQGLARVENLIKDRQIKALFVDPFISTHTVPENDNNAMDQVVTIFKRLAARHSIAINIAHHTRKTGGDAEAHAGDAESGRGASAIKDAARAAVTVARMGQATAKKLGIEDDERGNYIRMDVGKMNFAAHDSKATWFKIEQVILGNGDAVGVPKPVYLEPLFAQAADGRKTWTAERIGAAVLGLFPTTSDQVRWADVNGRFMNAHGIGKSAAGDYIKLLPQCRGDAISVGAYRVWITRSAPNNGWMIHRQGDDS